MVEILRMEREGLSLVVTTNDAGDALFMTVHPGSGDVIEAQLVVYMEPHSPEHRYGPFVGSVAGIGITAAELAQLRAGAPHARPLCLACGVSGCNLCRGGR